MWSDAMTLVIGTTVKWLIFTGLLWIMIKIQKLNYNFFGLLASSAAASLIGLIPYAGPYLAQAVLVFCLWKCTGADIMPDVIFTTSIARALMFCINLWVLGALMGDLRPDLAAARELDAPAKEMNADAEDDDDDESGELANRTNRSKALPAGKESKARPAIKGLVFKGVSLRSAQPLAMFAVGGRVYTVAAGEAVMVQISQTNLPIRCEQITRDSVVLTIGGGETLTLEVQ